MATTTTLVLGGGFGGLSCARALRERLGPEHGIRVVDRAPHFLVGATKTWVMLGSHRARDVVRNRRLLLPEGVEWIPGEVEAIDPGRRRVRVKGSDVEADHLVIALGAELEPGAIPGLADAAHSFYTLEGAERLHDALQSFRGGRIVLLVPRLPFKCPPAPYEAILMLHAWLEDRGLRGTTELEVHTTEKLPMATAGEEMGRMIVAELKSRGIAFHPGRAVAAVDGAARTVSFEDGVRSYDLLIAVPPHRVPRVVVESGLAATGGWIPVDPQTLEVRSPQGLDQVYAIGDVTALTLPGRHDPAVSLMLPKAGVFAAAEGEAVAERIAAVISGGGTGRAFDGRGFCYLEVGGGKAIRAEGEFFATPRPRMSARPASEAQFLDKLAWVEGWLSPRR